MASTRIGKHIDAPRSVVYRLLIDAEAVATWMVPTGMTSRVHEFDAKVGGGFRISLTYDEPTDTGKTTARTDTFGGRFVTLIPDEQVVEVIEFETEKPDIRGEMTVTYLLTDADEGGTDLMAMHECVPPGVAPDENEVGWRISLGKLADLAESVATG
ncbi:SRPBCC family protein [Nocardia sp. NPDC005366]|uniref:SRPBCC family protein n=1 Tax=Nocardia sp. NPDC005366 TaxID=3156878 RepID=UPI0033AD4445